MKSQLISALALTALLFAGSCAQDDLRNPAQGPGNVNFTVSLDSDAAATRAFGDGLSANHLAYAVYAAETGNLVMTNKYPAFSNSLSTTLSLDLADGKSYKIAFFAYNNSGSVYTFDATNKKVTVNYANMRYNFRDYDCFYKLEEIEVKGPVSKTVTLNRPVAQINWGTSDLDTDVVKAAYKSQWGDGLSLYTNMEAQAYNTLNLLTGAAEGELTSVSSSRNLSPVAETYGTFPVDGHDWLNMTYVLVPQDQDVMDCTLKTFTTSTAPATPVTSVEVSNVPVQRNYRTNIYGALLTNKADITVTKEPIFAGYNDRELWDGSVTTIQADADNVYTINIPSELAYIAKIVNGGSNLAGYTVKLNRDIDLNNINWTPIGTTGKEFAGSFDGNGHTIKNLYINLNGKPAAPAGLIGRSWNANTEIKNLTVKGVNIDVTGCTGKPEAAATVFAQGQVKSIDNVHVYDVTIKGAHYAGGIGGNFYGDITGCHAENVDITLGFYQTGNGLDLCDKAGGIFGLHGEGAGYDISGNSVRNVTIRGYRDLGGCFGMLQSDNVALNNTAENVTIYGITPDGDLLVEGGSTAQPGNFGGIVGRFAGTLDSSNTATGVTIYNANSNIDTLEELQTAINQGGYIQVTGDITIPGNATISKPAVIHMASGKKITVSNGCRIYNDSELTIEGDGIIEGGNTYIINNNRNGRLTINGGTISLAAGDSNQVPVYTEGYVTINGGTISNSNGNALRTNWANVQNPDMTLEINGGTFKSGANYALNIYGGADPGCKAVINGGTFIGATGGGRADNGVEVTINGGTFIGRGSWHGFCSGAESYGSEKCFVTVNDGYFFGSTTGYALCRAGQSTMTVKGGHVNKTTGYTPASGFINVEAAESLTIDGNTYNFTHKIVKQ